MTIFFCSILHRDDQTPDSRRPTSEDGRLLSHHRRLEHTEGSENQTGSRYHGLAVHMRSSSKGRDIEWKWGVCRPDGTNAVMERWTNRFTLLNNRNTTNYLIFAPWEVYALVMDIKIPHSKWPKFQLYFKHVRCNTGMENKINL